MGQFDGGRSFFFLLEHTITVIKYLNRNNDRTYESYRVLTNINNNIYICTQQFEQCLVPHTHTHTHEIKSNEDCYNDVLLLEKKNHGGK